MNSLYSKKVIKYFRNPKNMGEIKNPDAMSQVGNPICGDVMKMYLKIGIKNPSGKTQDRQESRIKNAYIKDIKFQTLGCAAAIATSSVITELAKGKTLKEAEKIDKQRIADELGGLPPIKMHCSLLAVEALHKAIEDYKNK